MERGKQNGGMDADGRNGENVMIKYEQGRVLVAAHRGVSGANIPCNTIAAVNIALTQGADIIEIDVTRSRDGELFVFHPGMEKPHLGIDASLGELSAAEISELRYINQDNVPTSYGVTKLEDMLNFLSGKAYINVDKFWMYMEEITAMLRKCNIKEQAVAKIPSTDEYLDMVEKCAPDIAFMAMCWGKDKFTQKALERNVKYAGVEALFKTDDDELVSEEYISKMHEKGLLLFGNAIVYNEAEVISAGHTDDLALSGNTDDGWGYFVKKEFDIIQTDWCSMLKTYLKRR